MEKNTIGSVCKVLLIGGSAGGLEALIKIVPKLTPHLSFAIVIVLHRKNAEDTILEQLIAAKATVPVKEVEDKIALEPGFIYIAPADYHLLFEKNNLLSLDISEKVNYSRPSIDVTFESAAEVYGQALVGILLSGSNADGTQGMKTIKEMGGKLVVQDPDSAQMPFMPRNAIAGTLPDYILNIEEILEFINRVNA